MNGLEGQPSGLRFWRLDLANCDKSLSWGLNGYLAKLGRDIEGALDRWEQRQTKHMGQVLRGFIRRSMPAPTAEVPAESVNSHSICRRQKGKSRPRSLQAQRELRSCWCPPGGV